MLRERVTEWRSERERQGLGKGLQRGRREGRMESDQRVLSRLLGFKFEAHSTPVPIVGRSKPRMSSSSLGARLSPRRPHWDVFHRGRSAPSGSVFGEEAELFRAAPEHFERAGVEPPSPAEAREELGARPPTYQGVLGDPVESGRLGAAARQVPAGGLGAGGLGDGSAGDGSAHRRWTAPHRRRLQGPLLPRPHVGLPTPSPET